MWVFRRVLGGIAAALFGFSILTEAAIIRDAALYSFSSGDVKLLVVLGSQTMEKSPEVNFSHWQFEGVDGEQEVPAGLYLSRKNAPNSFICIKKGGVVRITGTPSSSWGDIRQLKLFASPPAGAPHEYKAVQFDGELWFVSDTGQYVKLGSENFSHIDMTVLPSNSLALVLHPVMNRPMKIYLLNSQNELRPVENKEHAAWFERDQWRDGRRSIAEVNDRRMRLTTNLGATRTVEVALGAALQLDEAKWIESKSGFSQGKKKKSGKREVEVHFRREGSEIFADLPNDLHISLPINTQRLGPESQPLEFEMKDFHYNDLQHFILHFPHDPTKASESDEGEVILLREDGTFVLMGHSVSHLSQFEVSDDGILNHAGVRRKIDLTRLEAEARRPSKPKEIITAADGSLIDPMALLPTFAQDASRDLSLRDLKPSAADVMAADRMAIVLTQKFVRNPVLMGPSSSGKSHVLRVLRAFIAQGRYPFIPRTAQLWNLSASSMVGGTENVGRFENRVTAMRAISAELGYVFFSCDELTTLKGGGTHSGNPHNDIFEFMKEGMAAGDISLISATTPDDFRLQIASDPALVRRFQPVALELKTRSEVIEILRGDSKSRGLNIRTEELGLIYDLSEYFNAVEAQPGKAVAFGDRVFTTAVASQLSRVTSELIEATAADFYRSNLDRFSPSRRLALLDAFSHGLEREFIGDESVKRKVLKVAEQVILGTNDPSKPRGRILLFGKKGRGKTSLASLVHKLLHLPPDSFVRIQMSQVGGYNPVEKLLERIAEAAQRSSEATILLDDFEKADPATQNALLDILDSGRFSVMVTMNGGSKRTVSVDARRLFLILASNAGENIIRSVIGYGHGQSEPSREEIESALVNDGISPYVLSRIPNRLYQRSLSLAVIRILLESKARNILSELSASLRRPEIQEIEFNDAIERVLVGYTPDGSDPRVLVDELSADLRAKVTTQELNCLRQLQQISSPTLAGPGRKATKK
jgi:ATP-dependent Clp protease ATP-binding subunit ClpA